MAYLGALLIARKGTNLARLVPSTHSHGLVRNNHYVDQHVAQCAMQLSNKLKKLGNRIATELVQLNANKGDLGTLLKGKIKTKELLSLNLTEKDVDRYLDTLSSKDMGELLNELMGESSKSYVAGAKQGAKDIRQPKLFQQEMSDADKIASKWAAKRAAELISLDGKLSMVRSTKDMLRVDISAAIEEGLTSAQLAEVIQGNYAFSEARAKTIARTELLTAYTNGQLELWKRSGVVESKKWITVPDCCDLCDAMNGEVVELDAQFSNGEDGPPAHPNCRCDILAVEFKEEKAESNLLLLKGDKPGHPFRGNQWTENSNYKDAKGKVVVYHGTKEKVLAKILKDGLKSPDGSDVWVTQDESEAASYATYQKKYNPKVIPVIFKIVVPHGKWKSFTSRAVDKQVAVIEHIPASWIKEYRRVGGKDKGAWQFKGGKPWSVQRSVSVDVVAYVAIGIVEPVGKSIANLSLLKQKQIVVAP